MPGSPSVDTPTEHSDVDATLVWPCPVSCDAVAVLARPRPASKGANYGMPSPLLLVVAKVNSPSHSVLPSTPIWPLPRLRLLHILPRRRPLPRQRPPGTSPCRRPLELIR
ncbi:unnamed protein product [Ilex paraguariensis]|uniref:Uncharacterized protein n=1 Tax=Ilex paraguariensis TaxID=185542 RepID=A0ABC8TXM3_9AQUA